MRMINVAIVKNDGLTIGFQADSLQEAVEELRRMAHDSWYRLDAGAPVFFAAEGMPRRWQTVDYLTSVESVDNVAWK